MADTSYTLAGVSNTDTNMTASIELQQETDTIIKLNTDNKYLNKDIWLTMSVRSANVSLGGSTTTNGKAAAAITNTNSMAVITDITNKTAGTDYWGVKATASISTTPKFTPSLTVSQTGWLATAPTGSATNVTVNGDSTGKTIYIPRATFSDNGGNVVKYTTDGSNAGVNKTDAVLDAVSGTEPASGIYVAFTGSGNSKVATAGYIPKDATTTTGSSIKYFPVKQGKVTSGSATISSLTYTYQSDPGNFKITGSADVSAPASNTAGYIDGTYGTRSKNTGGATVSTTVAKVGLKATSSSTLTYQPAIKRQTPASGESWTDASSGAETTPSSVPASGVYVKVKSNANTGTITVSPAVSSNGYGTTSYYSATNYTGTIGASASKDTYIPITTATAAVTANQSIPTNPTISFPESGKLRATYSGSKTITGTLSNAGWVSSISSATVTTSGTTTVTTLELPATYNFSIGTAAGASTDAASGFTLTNKAYRTTTITNNANGILTITNAGTATVKSNSASTGTLKVNAYNNASTAALTGDQQIVTNGKWVYATIASEGSVTAAPSVAVTNSTTMSTTTTNTGYSFTVGGTPSNGTVQTKHKVTKMGWTPTYNATNGGTVTVTPSVSGGKTVYITAAVGAVTMTAGSGTCTHTSTVNATVSDSDTSGVYLGFKGKGSVSATATITTAGYAPQTASGGSFATGASTSSNQSSELKKYITGVEIKASKTFKLTVPNGSSTVEFTWTVDSSGNVVVT